VESEWADTSVVIDSVSFPSSTGWTQSKYVDTPNTQNTHSSRLSPPTANNAGLLPLRSVSILPIALDLRCPGFEALEAGASISRAPKAWATPSTVRPSPSEPHTPMGGSSGLIRCTSGSSTSSASIIATIVTAGGIEIDGFDSSLLQPQQRMSCMTGVNTSERRTEESDAHLLAGDSV
jgi:hypothetical protein